MRTKKVEQRHHFSFLPAYSQQPELPWHCFPVTLSFAFLSCSQILCHSFGSELLAIGFSWPCAVASPCLTPSGLAMEMSLHPGNILLSDHSVKPSFSLLLQTFLLLTCTSPFNSRRLFWSHSTCEFLQGQCSQPLS